MFDRMISEKLHSVNEVTCFGQLSPVASTGMSSYLSKLIPVSVALNSSLQDNINILVYVCNKKIHTYTYMHLHQIFNVQ